MKRTTITGKGTKAFNGLGDVVEAFTTATGIKAVAETYTKVTGKDCGCKKRKETLNKKFPFKGD